MVYAPTLGFENKMRAKKRRARITSKAGESHAMGRPKKTEKPNIFQIYPHLQKNYMSLASRIVYAFIALALVAYSLFSLFSGYTILPGKHQSALVVIGSALWLYVLAMWACSCHLIASIIAHYQRNEIFSKISKFSGMLAWVFFALGILMAVITPNETVIYAE